MYACLQLKNTDRWAKAADDEEHEMEYDHEQFHNEDLDLEGMYGSFKAISTSPH